MNEENKQETEPSFINPMLVGQTCELWSEAEHLSERIDTISGDVPQEYQETFDRLRHASETIDDVISDTYQAYRAAYDRDEQNRKA